MKLTKIKKDGELNYNVNNVGNNLMNGSKLAKYWKGKKFRSQAFTQTKIEDIENHINSANTVNKFGLKALTFGNWLTEQDKIEQLIGLTDALYSMHEILYKGYKTQLIGQNILSIALGARGTGGTAAHYEPGSDFINLTKPHIDNGSFFHEFAHYVDYNLAYRVRKSNGHGSSNIQWFLSGGNSVSTKIEQIDLNNKNEMIKTFAQLFQKLFYDEKGNETKFLKSLHKASPYYRKRAEIFARTSEVYISLKRKRENSILAKDKYRYNASIYPKPELVEKVEPLLDKIFLAYVKK